MERVSSGLLCVESGKDDNSADENERGSKYIESGSPKRRRKYSKKDKGIGIEKSVDKVLTRNVDKECFLRGNCPLKKLNLTCLRNPGFNADWA